MKNIFWLKSNSLRKNANCYWLFKTKKMMKIKFGYKPDFLLPLFKFKVLFPSC